MMAAIKAPDGSGTGWGSHQPALRAFARFTKVRSVVEFGAGKYSTHLFLDREAFPDLESLVTLEHDAAWAGRVKVDDDRFDLIVVNQDQIVSASKNLKADFVFLDHAPHGKRWNMIPHALTIAPIVAAHDSDLSRVKKYNCKYVKCFNTRIQTVFVSNTVDLSEFTLGGE